ncbi:MAG: FHA domain-containing protein [Chloroflexi bacterium]|nr:FHA domain-containing protein [Chloroflexota bacterium]
MQHPEENPLFIAQAGPLEGQRWAIRDSLLIGRDPDCDIIVVTPDKQVSRHHARLTCTSEGLELADLDSKNGTHVNGRRIEVPVLLADGDTVQVALAQQFVYLSSDATVPLELGAAAAPLGMGLLRLEKRARRVWIGNREIIPPLSVAQFSMLQLLYEASGEVVSRNQLIHSVWGEDEAYDVSNQALDALVRRLRDRLAEVDDEHEFIVTVRGHGLRLENPR